LDEDGFIKDSNESLLNKAAVYIYQSILDEQKVYIGSSYDINSRFNQHRTLAIKGSTACPIFYNSVRKYGWDNFKFGILEYIDLHPEDESEANTNIKMNKKIILEREQYYLDLLLPLLNVNKIAGSMLGYKHSEENLLKIIQAQRGKTFTIANKSNDSPSRIMSLETINKITQRVRGVIIRVFDKNDNLVHEFPTITETAQFYGVSRNTIFKYAENGKLWDNKFLFQMEFNPQVPKTLKVSEPLPLNESQFHQDGNLVEVFDKDNKLVYRFKSIRNAASFFNISHSTILRYIKDGKLWSNLYTLKIQMGIPIPSIDPSTLCANPSEVQVTPILKSDSPTASAKGFTVEVYNTELKLSHQFNSIREAAKMLGIDRSTVKQSADNGKLCRGLYFFLITSK
jgi:group I intron endonuclease